LLADGTVDTSFNYLEPNIYGSSGGVDGLAYDMMVKDNQIYAFGNIRGYNGIERRNILRLNMNGTLDESFEINNAFTSANTHYVHYDDSFYGLILNPENNRFMIYKIMNDGTSQELFNLEESSIAIDDQIQYYEYLKAYLFVSDNSLLVSFNRSIVKFLL
jgi:hypothetical protein